MHMNLKRDDDGGGGGQLSLHFQFQSHTSVNRCIWNLRYEDDI